MRVSAAPNDSTQYIGFLGVHLERETDAGWVGSRAGCMLELEAGSLIHTAPDREMRYWPMAEGCEG